MRILPTDSTAIAPSAADTAAATPKAKVEITPAQVLSWLPRDATPAQQDSAIQKHVKVSEIHWSERPDTLHLPGHQPSQSVSTFDLPLYYKASFFEQSEYFHPEIKGGRQGVAGDPVPYAIANDNLITGTLLACFILVLMAFSSARGFLIHQLKNFFRPHRDGTSDLSETSSEWRIQLFLVLQTCLLIAVLAFSYTREYVADTFIFEQWQIVGIYTLGALTYFLIKTALYGAVHSTFFGGKKSGQWTKDFLLLTGLEGVLLFPLVMLQAYFQLSMEHVFIGLIIIIILVKILTLYKSSIIFFNTKGSFLQIILYFCALEIVPMLLLWGTLVMMNNYLKVNF